MRNAAPRAIARRVRSLRPGWAQVGSERFLLRYPYSRFDPGGERQVLEAFLGAVEPGCLVFDIGANAGIYTLLACRAGARAVAFEPSPKAAALTRRHLALNDLVATVEEVVVTDESADAVTFYAQGSANTSSLSEASARTGIGLAPGRISALSRRATTIDESMLRHGPPHVIKLDVEGAELRALRGAGDWLARRAGVLFLEVHPWSLRQLDDSVDGVMALLRDAAWDAQLLDDNGNTQHFRCVPVD